ncbi:MAG: hypothetical protein QM770_00800 [Tepidisphaeraceae bacterium]
MADVRIDQRRETPQDLDRLQDRLRQGSTPTEKHDPNAHAMTKPHPHVDGTHGMTEEQQRSAGIIDDQDRKIAPGNAFLLVAAMFISVTVLAFLIWLVVSYMQQPELRPG